MGRNPGPGRVDAQHGHLGNQGSPGGEGRGARNGPEGYPDLSSGEPADDQEGRALSPGGTSLRGLYAERAASRGSGREQGDGELQERAADRNVAKDAVSQGDHDTSQGRTVE